MRTHYPRTWHPHWSPGATADDLRVTDLSEAAPTAWQLSWDAGCQA